jgi:hypothetical protein
VISRLSENTASRNLVGFNSQVANFDASRTLTLDDLGKVLLINNSGSFTVTVPNDSEANFGIGDRVDILQTGSSANVVTVSAGNATLFAESNKYKLNGQYAAATLIKTAANTWVLIGNITS